MGPGLDELLPGLLRRGGVVDVADRLGVALGTEALDLIEGQLRPGGDDEVVVFQQVAVAQLEAILLRLHALDAGGGEVDVPAAEYLGEVELDVAARAPVHRHPGVRRHEMERLRIRYDGNAVFLAQGFAQLEGRRQAADAGAHDHDVCHPDLLKWFFLPDTAGLHYLAPAKRPAIAIAMGG